MGHWTLSRNLCRKIRSGQEFECHFHPILLVVIDQTQSMQGINSSFEVKSRYCFINRSPPRARGLHILSADRDNSSKSVSVINERARRAGKYSMQSHLSQSKVNFALGQQGFTHNSATVGNVIFKLTNCKAFQAGRTHQGFG